MKWTAHLPILLGLMLAAYGQPPAQNGPTGLLQNKPQATPGYTLFSPNNDTNTYLMDLDGNVVHRWESQYPPGNVVYLLENGNLLRTASLGQRNSSPFHAGGAGGLVEEIDWDGNVVWSYELATDTALLHHDVEYLPNGNVLMIAWEYKSRDEAIAAGRDPDAVGEQGMWSDFIIEVKPTLPSGGEIVWEWHVWDHLVQDQDPEKANFGDVAAHPERIDINPIGWTREISSEDMERLEAVGYVSAPQGPPGREQHADWNHTNAVAYNPTLDQIALSIFAFNELWIIDHGTTTEEAAGHVGGRYGKGGDLLYRWGNPRAYRAGSVEDQQLFKQHDVHWIAPGLPGAGNLLIFNNGMGRPNGQYSTVLEIVTPVTMDGSYKREAGQPYGPVTPAWCYTATPKTDFYSMNISGAQRLPSGNTLICSGANGRLFEVTPKGETVWEYVHAGAAHGRPGPPGRGGRPPMPPWPDKDGDGRLSYEEASTLPFITKERFKTWDQNKDGALERSEMPRPGPRGPMPRAGQAPGLPPMAAAGMPGFPGLPPGAPGMMPPLNGPGGPRAGGPGTPSPGQGPGGSSIFRAYRYGPEFAGLQGKKLTPPEQAGGSVRAAAR